MYNIKDRIKDRIRNTKYGVRNLITWLPVIWKDRWWDSYFIYPILHKKLSMMESTIRKYGHHVYAERDADKIKVCVLILKRIMDDEYSEMAFKRHEEKWGDSVMSFVKTDNPNLSRMLIEYDSVKTEKDEAEERKDFRRAMEHEDYLRKQDIDTLFKIMSKQISSWWD